MPVPAEKPFGWLAAAGGALGALGSLLPWATVTTVFGSIDVAGTKGDGKWTAAIGAGVVFLAVVGVVQRLKGAMISAGVLAAVGAAVAGYDLSQASNKYASVSTDVAHVDVGIGLYLCVGGFVAALIFAFTAQQHYPPMQRAQFPSPD